MATWGGARVAVEETSGTRELWTMTPTAGNDTPVRSGAPEAHGGGDDRPPLNRAWAHLRVKLRRSSDPFTLARLEPPAPPRTPRLRRRRFEAWWSARQTLLDVDEFLRERLRRYLVQVGVAPERLPLSIAVAGGRITVTGRAGPVTAGDWLARYLRANGEAALAPVLARARMEAARADAALDEARERLSLARHDLDAAARAPSLSDDGGAGPCGDAAVPPPWSIAIHALVAAMVLADAWQFALPLLRTASIDPAEALAACSQRPGAVALAAMLALGASIAVFIFSAAAVNRVRALLDLVPVRWNAALHAAAGVTSLVAACVLAWALLGPGANAASARSWTPLLIALALPLSTPPLLRLASRLHAAHAAASLAAAERDRAHRAAVARWSRAIAIVTATERECAALAAARAAWTEHVRRLQERVADVTRAAADAADAEASALRDVAHAVVAALELDRGVYLRRRDAAAPLDGPESAAHGADVAPAAIIARTAESAPRLRQ